MVLVFFRRYSLGGGVFFFRVCGFWIRFDACYFGVVLGEVSIGFLFFRFRGRFELEVVVCDTFFFVCYVGFLL